METFNLPSIILPGQREIQLAVSRINSKVPGFFDKVKEIRVGPGGAGFGYVTNNPKDEGVIFLDLPRIKTTLTSRMPGANPEELTEAIIKALYEIIAHEQGHIQDELKGGEMPAEQKAREVVNMIGTACDKFYNLVKVAAIFKKAGENAAKTEKMKRDLIIAFPDLIKELKDIDHSVTLQFARTGGVESLVVGSPITIKHIVWDESTPTTIIGSSTKKFTPLQTYVNKPNMEYGEGPWTITLPE